MAPLLESPAGPLATLTAVLDDLTTTTGIAALAAAAIGLIALVFCIVLAVKLRRVRAAQLAVLGDDKRDLVSHAARLETGFTDLREWVEDALAGSEQRMNTAEQRIDGCIAYRALVRYDAYNELSGAQSSSFALLDAQRSGVVVSSIVHRDQARTYVKLLHAGEAEVELSPEEQQAVDEALTAPARAA
ncbi:MAG: hypothetical protein QOJ07_2028 [Thermoleophilaceae bacterium]|nr:hypothetical protein [Thermoleophilaceae bacterium]